MDTASTNHIHPVLPNETGIFAKKPCKNQHFLEGFPFWRRLAQKPQAKNARFSGRAFVESA
jgi:hypothetical protein